MELLAFASRQFAPNCSDRLFRSILPRASVAGETSRDAKHLYFVVLEAITHLVRTSFEQRLPGVHGGYFGYPRRASRLSPETYRVTIP